MSGDGNTLYTVNPELVTVTVIGAASMGEIRSFTLGERPTFVIAAP